jgi:uncharacterized protein (TIGR02145 family)
MKVLRFYIFIICYTLIQTACNNADLIPRSPSISDDTMSIINDSSVIISCKIASDGISTISQKGVCWSQFKDPNTADSVIEYKSSADEVNLTFGKIESGKIYYFRTFATNQTATVYGALHTYQAPNWNQKVTLNTLTVNQISYKEIRCKINLISIGNPTILEKGICWSKHPNPTILDSKKTTGSQLADSECNITGLDEGTTYYFKDYVITPKGIQYGNEYTLFTPTFNPMNPEIVYGSTMDIQFNIYKTIKIGSQTWMAENLRATIYQNGDPIPYVINDWNSDFGVQCTYRNTNNIDSISKFGRLYNWYSTDDQRKISPEGWHIPSIAEQKTLVEYLFRNGYNYDGAPSDIDMTSKSLASNTDWQKNDVFGTPGYLPSKNNKTGFNAYPSGGRGTPTVDGSSFQDISKRFEFWLRDENNFENGAYCTLYYATNFFNKRPSDPRHGMSIRCIKDN